MKQVLKSVLKKVPFAFSVAQFLHQKYLYYRFKRMSAKEVFSYIHKTNAWGDLNSVSGPGSNLEETKSLVEKLPELLRKHHASSVLDIPCGDFFWMKNVDLENIDYQGADIVSEIVAQNKKYEKDNVSFEQLDLLQDKLPKVDVIFVRDCFVHLSYNDVFKALENICKSDSKSLLTTTFSERKENTDIATGQWRALNLCVAPFNFPEPQVLLNEACPQEGWEDKSLGLWEVADILDCLRK